MVQEFGLIEIDIDGRTSWVRPVGSWVLESNNVVAEAPWQYRWISPWNGPSGSSSRTQNSTWNFEL